MSDYQVIFYTTKRGDSPIDDFLDSLDRKSKAKIEAYIAILRDRGPDLTRPYADHVKGKIRELRPGSSRILYCFFLKKHILLLHVLKKKTFRLPHRDIEQAQRNMNDYITRYKKGEITL